MKKLAKAFLVLIGVICFIGECLEVLLLPLGFLIFGLWQQMPWQFYAITIGGYFGLLLVLNLLLHLIFRLLGKHYASRFEKALTKLITKFSTEDN